MADLVDTTDPEGVDFGWVMQMTFVITILVGAPIVAGLSILVELPTWGSRVSFAIRVGAPIWFLTAVGTFLYAKYKLNVDEAEDTDLKADTDADANANADVDGNIDADADEPSE